MTSCSIFNHAYFSIKSHMEELIMESFPRWPAPLQSDQESFDYMVPPEWGLVELVGLKAPRRFAAHRGS